MIIKYTSHCSYQSNRNVNLLAAVERHDAASIYESVLRNLRNQVLAVTGYLIAGIVALCVSVTF
jgi:hypothetical protein